MKFFIIILLILAFALTAYHIFLVVIGKRLARLVQSKDRFIWNQLKVHQAPEGFSAKRATLFLDEDHLVLSGKSLMPTYYELKKSGGLDHSLAIRFDAISNFEYSKKKEASFLGFIGYIFHKILLNNSYYLIIEYVDDYLHPQKVTLSAASLDLDTFEATFADFDHKIYQKRVGKENYLPPSYDQPPLRATEDETVRLSSTDSYPDMKTVRLRTQEEAVVHKVTTDQTEILTEKDEAIAYQPPTEEAEPSYEEKAVEDDAVAYEGPIVEEKPTQPQDEDQTMRLN